MGISISSIYGFNVGFAVIPPELAEEHDALYGLMLDFGVIRIILWRVAPE